jgi:S1-C subfamily serine protease
VSHSHGDCVDVSSELGAAMPARFCQSRWRQMLVGFTVIGALVLGIALEERLRREAERAHAPIAQHGHGPAAAGVAIARSSSTQGNNVVLIAGAQRTAFNRAAHAIRPSVLSVRASFDQKDATGRDLERRGSAVIVDAGGYAVTCHHVVAGATRVLARRFREPERWLPARLIAIEDDLALFKISDDQAFAAATLGSSERVQVGDWVLAVGHPFGLGLTVTAGIVGRRHATLELPDGRRYDGLLMTDAPINEGSSGGPLVDSSGRVIGMNTAIYAPTGVFSGAGFAIPSDRVRKFVERALSAEAKPVAGAAGAGWGIGVTDLTPSLSAELAYPAATGVLINRVVPGSPAQAAQLSTGDVVTAIAGQAVTDVGSVRQIRERLQEATAVPIRIWRRGTSVTLVLEPRNPAG